MSYGDTGVVPAGTILVCRGHTSENASVGVPVLLLQEWALRDADAIIRVAHREGASDFTRTTPFLSSANSSIIRFMAHFTNFVLEADWPIPQFSTSNMMYGSIRTNSNQTLFAAAWDERQTPPEKTHRTSYDHTIKCGDSFNINPLQHESSSSMCTLVCLGFTKSKPSGQWQVSIILIFLFHNSDIQVYFDVLHDIEAYDTVNEHPLVLFVHQLSPMLRAFHISLQPSTVTSFDQLSGHAKQVVRNALVSFRNDCRVTNFSSKSNIQLLDFLHKIGYSISLERASLRDNCKPVEKEGLSHAALEYDSLDFPPVVKKKRNSSSSGNAPLVTTSASIIASTLGEIAQILLKAKKEIEELQ